MLTSASRSAPPWRLNGTSAAAPHVTGIVALVFEYFRKRQTSQPYQPLSVSALLTALSEQPGVRLVPNRRASLQARKRKQVDVWNDLVVPGKGEISCINTLDNI